MSVRRSEIENLRAITISLLMIYHVVIVFQSWGREVMFIISEQPIEWLWILMSVINVWRIPILFLISGMAVTYAIEKKTWRELMVDRSIRILLPLVFGSIFIVPLHQFIYQIFYQEKLNYYPFPGHLWFLGNIYIYIIFCTPIIFYLKRNTKIINFLKSSFSRPSSPTNLIGILILFSPLVLEATIINPERYESYLFSWHGLLLGANAFLLGGCAILSGEAFWKSICRWRWYFFAMAMGLFLLRLLIWDPSVGLKIISFPDLNSVILNGLKALESVHWMLALFGFFHHFKISKQIISRRINGSKLYSWLGRVENRVENLVVRGMSCLSKMAYPIYIVHMFFLYVGAYWILPLKILLIFKFFLILIFVFSGSILFSIWIRRKKFLRPLFGLKFIEK